MDDDAPQRTTAGLGWKGQSSACGPPGPQCGVDAPHIHEGEKIRQGNMGGAHLGGDAGRVHLHDWCSCFRIIVL
ncbi:uncharacterized protein STEHIDRAFT_117341 [Stereum hirsutum FP-91666 SS1]|uniref:uncharacterized protein n=1 Tax=Stereum hirsutum (strain FP-91666) TaxID=721885 RepID=UPI000440A74D|nr:uncharacterized protein STEHIDRAFT_117341 [Stereum hirsutum FP-91666 SS1]EIM92304.1 hypothetical protein STEHIDRAFT_117341 [Stereum hirsutum FP-91666 SS1]